MREVSRTNGGNVADFDGDVLAAGGDDADPADLLHTGEAAGEDVGASERTFFVSKKAAAVLKHGVLKQYVLPFASKVGSMSAGGRVVYVDGYAGPGRYADGTEGSPVLILDEAKTIAAYRSLECHFVEKSRSDAQRLRAVVAEAQAAGVACEAHLGRLEDHLDAILERAAGYPLFLFLDPFGLGLAYNDLVDVLRDKRPPAGAPTEVLLNFSSHAVRRIGGVLRADRADARSRRTVEALDRACGGDWWHEEFLSARDNAEAVERIADGFLDRVCRAAKTGGWSVPVRNRSDHQPVYHLVFFTRHREGLYLFGDALSLAQQEWRRACQPPPREEQPTLFGDIDMFAIEETARVERWVDAIAANIERLLVQGDFVVGEKYTAVFGDTIGEARQMHVRAAIKRLYAAGRTSCNGKGNVVDLRVTRPSGNGV